MSDKDQLPSQNLWITNARTVSAIYEFVQKPVQRNNLGLLAVLQYEIYLQRQEFIEV